jgi:uncharacterized protein involved in exopolysaccharide biosynthesis
MLANVTHEYVFKIVDKAVAPDADDPVRPRKLLLIAGGPLLGFAVAVILLLALDWLGFGRAKQEPV